MKNTFLFFCLLFSFISSAQTDIGYAIIDKKMAAIPNNITNSTASIAHYIDDNFKTENDKIRAIFYWTASNISYDVPNMNAVHIDESPQDRIAKALKTNKGVCTDYALIFNEIATILGIQSVVIDGYTKQNGKIATLSHAWCAAKIENNWYVFDPTWGSGYVNNNKYTRKLDNNYFKTAPEKSINSHMPFDYLWQFMNYPVTQQEFIEGKTQVNKTKKFFDFEKEISKYESLPPTDQLFESADRIEKNGLKNKMITERYESKKRELAYLRQSANIEKLNSIVRDMNDAVVLLNDFILYRNNKFKPSFSDEVINEMIQKPKEKLTNCQKEIYNVGPTGSENAANLNSIKRSIEKNLALAEEQAVFVKTYLSKSKLVRKTMFSKVTWFGLPLN
jgi:hypothetical protein